MGYKAIASAVDLSRDIVRTFCKSKNLMGFGRVTAMNIDAQIEKGSICKNCLNFIKQPPKGRRKKFCSEKCRREWWKQHPENINQRESARYKLICTYCGREFISYGNRNRKYCSHECYIQDRFYKEESI